MERLRRVVNEVAYAKNHHNLPALHRSLIPFLYLTSSLYKVALSIRRSLYNFGFFSSHRLPVPVISVGNLTWGGNGKTPMVEFIASWLADSGIPPLILTRGYGGGDEVKMLSRHFLDRAVKIGIGANRAATAACFLKQYGHVDPSCLFQRMIVDQKLESQHNSSKIGVVVLDDGMQHWSLQRDVEIVMINAISLWGNLRLVPLGPLREPLRALERVDVVVVHHSDLVAEQTLKDIVSMVLEFKESLAIFFTRMCPSYFFEVGNINSSLPLDVLKDAVVLCVSAIGSANAFVRAVEKMRASHVHRLDFSDHYKFREKDMNMIRMEVQELERKFATKPLIVITEKDYDRDAAIFNQMSPSRVLVLCSELQIISYGGHVKESFTKLLTELLRVKSLGRSRL